MVWGWRFCSYIFTVVGTLPARGPVDCELLTLSQGNNSCARSTVPPRVTAPVPFLSTSTSCVPPRASDTVACHASRERESAEVAKAAAQLLSREPRVFSRPNVRGTLVAVEKAASHSVSLITIFVWGARSRFKALQAHLAELLDSQQLIFPVRFLIYINLRLSLGPVACELFTLS